MPARINSEQQSIILFLHNVYVVYLIETERDGCNYLCFGYTITFFQIRKVAWRLQCNFYWQSARKNRKTENNGEKQLL